MRKIGSSAILLTVALLLGSVFIANSQDENCRYFEQTGHHVCGKFLEFFEARGGSEIFGYPLTEEFTEPKPGGLRIQYFQRARMEWHPHNPKPYDIQLGLLVDELSYIYPPALPEQIPASNNGLHHYFPETQHVVSYAFLDYFREKGGVDIFGYPRSEFMYEAGYIVQYFQRARMEWHPEDTAGSQIRLTNLGEIYMERPEFQAYALPVPSARPDPTTTLERTPLEMEVNASVRYVITGREGIQTVFVYVNDQQYRPIPGADVKMVVHYQSGDQNYELGSTDISGFTKMSFDIFPSSPGKRVVIDVIVTYDGLERTTQTFFLTWW